MEQPRLHRSNSTINNLKLTIYTFKIQMNSPCTWFVVCYRCRTQDPGPRTTTALMMVFNLEEAKRTSRRTSTNIP